MSFINKHKGKIITTICIIALLVIAFFCGGNNSDSTSNESINNKIEEVSKLSDESVNNADLQTNITQETHTHGNESMQKGTDKNTGIDEHNTELVAAGESVPAEPEEAKEAKEAKDANELLTCTLSIRCDNVVGKSNEKSGVIPKDGVIMANQTVVFYKGESVFNVLVRELKKNKIHLEFVNVPVYNSAYIEGIANLYEFDFGELSGWMYKVNDWFPNYGCSRYQLKEGDKVEWVYTCDLGHDVGGHYSARNGK